MSRSRPSATAGTSALGADWIRPHWLERQLDPRSPSFVPFAQGSAPENLTSRNWTRVGTVASPAKGTVDQRGLLTPWPDGWSLDWWIGGEDRWHFPSRERAVRQQLVGDAPVIETAMRIAGGDVVHRVYGVPGGMAVVEITNATATPLAVGFAIRPFNPTGLAAVGRIGLEDRTVTVDGRPAAFLPRRPQRMAVSTFRGGDAAHLVMAEELASGLDGEVRCDAGLATAAFLFPIAHRQTLRMAVPLGAPPATRRRQPPAPALTVDALPDSDAVVRSWEAQTTSRGMRLVLPEGRLASAIEANRRYLLLFHEGDDVVGGPSTLGALDEAGFHGESAEVLASLRTRTRIGAEGVHAIAQHWRLTGSLEGVDPDGVAGAARRIERRHDRTGRDALWSLRALLDAAALLRALGIDPVADECDRWAASQRGDVDAWMAAAAGGDDPGMLEACAPLALVPADHPAVSAAAQLVRERLGVGAACADGDGHGGLSTSLTMQLAAVELEAGDRTCLDRLSWLLEVASPTFTWPPLVHPVLGGGSMGDGHDAGAAVHLLSFVRRLLVRETDQGGLALCTMLPDAWTGQNLEVHDAPTHHGTVSFAVRWHGDRPALLWDRKVRGGETGVVRITAPGLDPSWSSTEPKGEALLAAPPAATSGTATVTEGSFS